MPQKCAFHCWLSVCQDNAGLVDAMLEICLDAEARAIYLQAVCPERVPPLDERDWVYVRTDGIAHRF
jgi:hypothetical protein